MSHSSSCHVWDCIKIIAVTLSIHNTYMQPPYITYMFHHSEHNNIGLWRLVCYVGCTVCTGQRCVFFALPLCFFLPPSLNSPPLLSTLHFGWYEPPPSPYPSPAQLTSLATLPPADRQLREPALLSKRATVEAWLTREANTLQKYRLVRHECSFIRSYKKHKNLVCFLIASDFKSHIFHISAHFSFVCLFSVCRTWQRSTRKHCSCWGSSRPSFWMTSWSSGRDGNSWQATGAHQREAWTSCSPGELSSTSHQDHSH